MHQMDNEVKRKICKKKQERFKRKKRKIKKNIEK